MTKAVKNRLNGKAEAILMGMTQCVESNEEAIYIIDYICKVLNKEETGQQIFDEATKYTEGAEIKAVNICTVEDMMCISLPMTTEEDEEEFNLLNENGTFSYVYNFDCPYFSELGYCTFIKTPKGIKRRY